MAFNNRLDHIICDLKNNKNLSQNFLLKEKLLTVEIFMLQNLLQCIQYNTSYKMDYLNGTYCRDVYNPCLGTSIKPSTELCMVGCTSDFARGLSVVRGRQQPQENHD